MRKVAVFSSTIFLAIIVAGMYGILHDQVTYFICPEYYTKFKFEQFGFDPAILGGDKLTAAAVGFLATWWAGFIVGLTLGIIGLTYDSHNAMKTAIKKGLVIVLIVTLIFSVIGFFRGRYYLSKTGVSWWLPPDLINRADFITAGSIHNYSYLGGAAGLLLAVTYLFVRKFKTNLYRE